MIAHELRGLDSRNPLGFLAALGLLRVLDFHAGRTTGVRPLLCFDDRAQDMPILHTTLARDEIVGLVLEDAANDAYHRALGLAYDEDGKLVPPSTSAATRDLKPPPAAARAFLEQCATSDRRTAEIAAAFFSELVQDNNGNTKPTAFHFTAGQQAFLKMVDAIRRGIGAEDVHEAINGPWRNTSQLPSLSWDSSVTRLYALRASNPSGEKRGSVPGAYWLAVQALGFFPVNVRRRRLVTTCVVGGWNDAAFTWPLWMPPISSATIAALLRCDAASWSFEQRAAFGVTNVIRARIVRSDYGAFAPADIVVPPVRREPPTLEADNANVGERS